jgi:hypothetical protein
MRPTICAVFVAVCLLGGGLPATPGAAAPATRMVQLETRPGIDSRLLLYRPEHPTAAVILFPDGSGRLGITHLFNHPELGHPEQVPHKLVKNLVQAGILVALMDAPADHRSVLGLNGWHGPTIFRTSADHARDVGAVADYLATREALPVWLAGIRMGAYSAVNAAIHLPRAVAGLVIVDGITECPPQRLLLGLCPAGLTGLPLRDIRVPTLILAEDPSRDFAAQLTGVPPAAAAASPLPGPAIRSRSFAALMDFESFGGPPSGLLADSDLQAVRISREIGGFIRWTSQSDASPHTPVFIEPAEPPDAPFGVLFVCLY